MEDLCPISTCNVMELLPFFLDISMESPPIHVPPSRLLIELQMPMQKRFEQLTKSTRKRRIITEFNTFNRNPDVVVFQNYEAYQTYKTSITFINTKTISRNLKIRLDFKSPFFEVVRPTSDLDIAKVAPGMAYIVTIIFSPTEMRDYVTKLICDTNEETIIVPIYGLGTRPLLKIVDEIKLSPSAVRVTSEKSILLHNLGSRLGHYRVSVEKPFSVVPKKGVLEPNRTDELKISCTPIIAENPNSQVILVCEDIVLKIPICCEIEEANLSLRRQNVDFFEVYVGLQNYATTTVHNKSPFTIDFRWKLLASEKDDVKKIKSVIKNMESLTELEKSRYTKLEYHDVINSEGHEQILDYKFREYAESINEEFKLLYSNEVFSIIPLEGKILPQQSFDFNIIFAPKQNDVYLSSAYLDVTGKHERFHLCLSGIGRGPSVIFNINKLHTGTIFLEAVHEYQVVAKNEGCIPATVVFQKKETEFGGEIGCNPEAQYLKRIDSCKTFIVNFSSTVQGPFIEKVYFKIKESNELIYFLLIGNVVCPLLKPDVDKLDFGKIAFGTVITKYVFLTNPSQIPIDFQIKMSKINYSEMLYNGKKEKKADFTYKPDEGVVGPFGTATIEITLLTNVIDNVKENMIIKMYGSDLYSIEIPCTYTCLIPTITCEPQDIYITFCFLNFVYKRTLTFTNKTNLTGQLNYTPLDEPPNMKLTLSPTEIYVTPYGVFEVEMTITTDVLGLHEFPLMFTLLGQEKPTRWCNLRCNGQGPVISYFPDDINFGKVMLLTRKVRNISFVNDSPIKAVVFLSTNDKSVIQLPVDEFELLPECEINVEVVCFLTQDGKFDCHIFVDIENGENIVINVCGEGIGYPIQCVPDLEPVYDLGYQLTYINNKLTVSISNLGKKYYRLYWSRKSIIRNIKELTGDAENSLLYSVFTIEPNYLELGENDTEEIDIFACSKTPIYFEENFYLHAIMDASAKQVVPIKSVLLKVTFLIPVMSFSANQLDFMEMHVPTKIDPLCTLDEVEMALESISTSEVTIKNEVEIPLNLMMQTTNDFFIKRDNELIDTHFHRLEAESEYTVTIEFKPLHISKRYKKQLGKLTINIPEYPKTESIFLTGELCFPSVQFLPPETNFGCIAYGSSSNKFIILQNITFLPVKFSLELSMDSFVIEKLPDISHLNHIDGLFVQSGESDQSDNIVVDICTVNSQKQPLVEKKLTEEKIVTKSSSAEEQEKKSEKTEISFQPMRRFSTMRKVKSDLGKEGSDYISEKYDEELKSQGSTRRASKRSFERDIKSPSEQFVRKINFSSQDILIKSSLPDALKVQGTAKDVLNDFLYNKYEAADSTEIESRDFWNEMKLRDISNAHSLRNIITMEPWEGCLKPYEYGLINISFHPPPNTSVKCTAICKIEGGENEQIKVSGSCSNITFSFDKTSIDVGRKLFCEIFEETITLKNEGYYEFPIKVRCDKEEIFSNKMIKAKWLNIYPNKYFIEAGESVTFDIRYFPGMTGPFEEDIVFDIDFLDPIKIPLMGYAVFSQVALNIPRQELGNIYRNVTYRGIATITDKYLLGNLSSRKLSHISMLRWDRVTAVHEDRYDLKFQCLLEDDWEVIFRDDLIPSAQELELAVERMFLNDHLCDHYEELKRHSISRKFKMIPDFKVPPYRLNFGNVIVEKPVCFTINITNIGPEPAAVKVIKNTTNSTHVNDMTIEFKPKLLDEGEVHPLHVILRPALKAQVDYDDRCIRDVIFLVVTHGATIPIIITATLALPRIAFIHKCIDFGMVKLGNAFRQTVIIENYGCLTCNWETEVRSLNQMKPSYYVIPNNGELLAFTRSIMNIYFVPERKGFYNAEILVQVLGCPKQVRLKLCGDGVQPTLIFKESNVKFNPCIPYTTENLKELLVQNVSTYPIEFCFSDFERDYDEEKMLVQLFLNYHNLQTVFIPEREPGGGTPEIFLTTFNMLESELRKILGQSEDEGEIDMLTGYNKEQIVELINKYIDSVIFTGSLENSTDIYPIENKNIEGLAIIDPPRSHGQGQKKGVMIIFHGAPVTGYLTAAFQSGKKLRIDKFSIDRLIYEELVEKKSGASIQINELIDEAFSKYDDPIVFYEWDDDYDILMKKIEIIINVKPTSKKKGGAEEKNLSKDSEKASMKTELSKASVAVTVPIKGAKGKKGADTLLDIPPQLFAQLLKAKFEKFSSAMIIESLDSIFIWSPLLCFECLLHGIHNITYISVVILSLTLNEFIENEAKKIVGETEPPDESECKEFNASLIFDQSEESYKFDKKKGDKRDTGSKSTKNDAKTPTVENKLEATIKQISKDIPKDVEQSFKDFSNLMTDINDVCESWDRKECAIATQIFSTEKIEKKSKKKPLTAILKFTQAVNIFDRTNVGIPLLIMDKALPDKDLVYESIYFSLQGNIDLQKAMESLKCLSQVEIEESSFMYSVLKENTRYNKNLSDVFKLVNLAGEDKHFEISDHTPLPSPAVSTMKTVRAKKKKKLSASKIDHSSIMSPTYRASSDRFCCRSIINPGDIMKYEISFHPQVFGVYSHKYRLEIIGHRPCLFVKCKANCELPKLDYTPEVMFTKCLENIMAKKIDDKFIYLKEENILDFGTLIVAGTKTPPYITKIILRNISMITCQTLVILEDDSDFNINSSEFEILPDNQVELIVKLQGRTKGVVDSELYISIQNNPMVYRLRLLATVAPLDFIITPKLLNFDKIPVDYMVKQYIKLINSTCVDLKWRFARCEWALKIYKISKVRGMVKMNSMDRIEVEFKPTREEIYPQKTIEIQIFNPLCSEEVPFFIDYITLQSEAMEYLVEYTDHVDLGEIKGKVDYKFPLKLYNNGKTNVHMVLEKLLDHPDNTFQKIRSLFNFNFPSEILQPQKQSSILIEFNSTEEMEFQEAPIFVCKFLDPYKPQNVVKSFQIKYSAIVLLSKFSICPASGVHFGALELLNKRSQIIQLKNIGKCNFRYNISYLDPTNIRNIPVVPPIVETGETKSKELGRSNKNHPSLTKLKVASPPTLEIPGYIIFPSTGTLDAGQSAELTVTFLPKVLGVYKETVVLCVSEPVKEHVMGKKISLYGEAAEPWLDFQNISKIFKEHYIVNKAEELIIPSDIGTYTYFVISKNTLYFENVCVKKECNGKIYLQNLGQLIAVVVVKVLNCFNFTVSPTHFTIDPYNTAIITVTFKPDSINVFEGKLEISTNATTNNIFELMLHGRSYVPQIKISGLPSLEVDESLHKIYFKPTYINEIQTHKIEISNIGVIECKVIIDVTDSGMSMFYVVQDDNFSEIRKENKDINLVCSSLKISLKPTESNDIYLIFKPYKQSIVDTFINIYIVDNPFETNKIQVFGHCYGGDIYIDTLEAFNPRGWSSKNTEIAYLLDFGQTPLKCLQKIRFTISNNSPKEIYKFEFKCYIDTLKFIPKVGHLKPLSSKEILAVNSSDLPFILIKELITFNYIPISFLTEQTLPLAWDERQQLLTWIEDGFGTVDDLSIQQHFRECVNTATDTYLKTESCEKSEVTSHLKLSLEREEPEVIYNAEDWQVIDIFVSFTTDYALYASPITEIEFPITFVKNKSEVMFDVKNCGRVPIHIEWKVVYDDFVPKYPSVEIVNKPEAEEGVLENGNGVVVDADSLHEQCLSSSTNTSESAMYIMHPRLIEIEPKKTSIPINQNGQFTVTFSPLAACNYYARLISNVEAIHPDLRNMKITIIAESVVPDYYFELENSDYLKRRSLTRCLKHLDDKLKIFEIHAVGVGITTIKRFCVLNTSNHLLNFKMEPLEQGSLSYLHCKTTSGCIQKGKKYEMVFDFTTQELGTFEEDYMFTIEKNDKDVVMSEETVECKEVETRFLIVGICRNPRVYFKVAHLNLKPTLLRISTQETIFLKNDEDEELGFKIVKESLYSYDHLQKLKVVPNSGSILPKTEITMQLIYNAETVGDSTFSIQCVVDRMTTPLTLNVSTKCLEVECKIQYIDQSGEEVTLDPNNENIICLGKIGIKTKNNVTFLFTNMGKTGFFYTWHYNKSHIEHLINVSPKKEKEFLSAGSTVKRELTFETYKKYKLVNFPMNIEISYGPIYNLKISVAAEFPLCKLSFTNYNFGNCLIQPFFTKNYTIPLIVKNLEAHPVKLDNLFEENDNLTVDFKSELINPKCTKIFPFYFHPRKEGQYEFMVPIVLNCTKRFIKISGTGVKINLQLMRASDKFIDLGQVKMGESKKYSIFVINRTPTQMDTTLLLSQDYPVDQNKENEKLKPEIVVPYVSPRLSFTKNKKGGSSTLAKTPKSVGETKETGKSKTKQEEKLGTNITINTPEEATSEFSTQKPNFFIEPKDPVKMEFNKKYEFLVEFRPTERLESFTQKIFYKIQHFVAPLCSIKGTCLVPEFSLDKEVLTFSNVLVDTPRVKYVLLRNTGDLPLTFKWHCENIKKYFKVHPVEGYVKQKSDVKVDFTFKISTVECQLVKKCKCIINNTLPLELTLVANSITKPPPVSTIIFTCPVRQKIIENVNIANTTKTLWHLHPVISNKNFIIPSEIVVEPVSVSAVPVEYHPKQIINEEATLILPLPDEEILYEFIGKPLPPLPEKRFALEIRSKQDFCQVLPVYNWTDFKLCFEVETILVNHPTVKTLYKTYGLDLVDLLPGEVKEYKWNIYSINEEPLEFQVIFRDKQSKEYMFYEIVIKVNPPEPIDSIELISCVRKPVKTKIKLKNPINIPVEYNISSPNPELHFRNIISMQPYSTHDLEVIYFPIKHGHFLSSIDAKCDELGIFTYTMYLEADPPSAEKTIKFLVELGDRGYASAEIKNTFYTNMDVSLKFDHPEFTVEKFSKIILPGESASYTILFEPSFIGVLESKLTINSVVSGMYIFPLYGECIPPTPKGPFLIKPGVPTSIPFFNPFNETKVFFYTCDSDKFELKVSSEEIKEKKPVKIVVSCPAINKEDPVLSCPYTGRLIVSCDNIKWPFYLLTES